MNLNGISSLFLATAAEIGLGVAHGIVAVAAVIVTVLFIMQNDGRLSSGIMK